MKSSKLAISLLLSACALASPTPEDSTLAERCMLTCATGYELYLNPAPGQCTCVERLVQWTNPATGLCACVHPCGVASELPCPTGFVCTPASPNDVCLAESCLSC